MAPRCSRFALPRQVVPRHIASWRPVSLLMLPLLAALLLTACGFRLQGRVPLPASLASTWIETEDAQSDFVVDLKRALRASGATLAARREEATAVLRVERDELTESVLSVSGRNLPREVELTYTVRLAVEGQGEGQDEGQGQGRTLLPSEEFAVSRDQSFVEEQLLAKEREQEILRAALARDLVGVVMRRLSSLP
jgi:LPS-assembly lipoprotein